MIGVPALDQFIEAMVFDVPSLMPKTDYSGQGNLLRWQRGYPYPIAGLQLVLLVQLTPYRIGLQRTNHPYGNLHLRPRNQTVKIPPPTIARSKGSRNWRHGFEQRCGILKEVPAFILEEHQRVLAAIRSE